MRELLGFTGGVAGYVVGMGIMLTTIAICTPLVWLSGSTWRELGLRSSSASGRWFG